MPSWMAERTPRSQPSATTPMTQNNPLGAQLRDRRQTSSSVHNGGYRVTVAASDHHAARLVFQGASVLIDYVLIVLSDRRL